MRAEYTTSNGRLKFVVEGATAKDIWGELGEIQELFDAENQCGCCQSNDIHYRKRVSKAKSGKNAGSIFDYYELVCMDCHARFEFGALKPPSTSLFPKRRGEDGQPLPNGGWSKYNPNSAQGQEDEIHHRTQQQPAMPKSGGQSELERWMERIDADLGSCTKIFMHLMERMEAVNQGAEYNRITEKFGQKKRPEVNDYKACVADLYAVLKRYE